MTKPKRIFPKKIGTAVDRLYEVRQMRQKVQREADEIKKYENALIDHLVDSFSKDELAGGEGKKARLGIKRDRVASVKDWDAFYAFVKKKNAFDLLQRRVNNTAWHDRIEEGQKIPGVEPFTVIKISVTKRK